jgi:hypothetical protein
MPVEVSEFDVGRVSKFHHSHCHFFLINQPLPVRMLRELLLQEKGHARIFQAAQGGYVLPRRRKRQAQYRGRNGRGSRLTATKLGKTEQESESNKQGNFHKGQAMPELEKQEE